MLRERQLSELLALYPVLLDLPLALRQQVESEGNQLKIERGRTLFDVGAPCTQFLLITCGSLRVVKQGANGREVLLYRVRPGEICLLTLSCLVESTSYVARGIAETDVVVVGITRSLFLSLLDQSSSFRLFILRFLSRRMRAFIGLVEEVVFGTLERRLAMLLLEKGIAINTTHQSLADELGSTREAVSRTLESLAEQGLVVLERGRITILDRAALEIIAKSVR